MSTQEVEPVRLTLENCTCLYVGMLQKTFKKKALKDDSNIQEEELRTIVQSNLEGFTVNGQTFQYTSIRNRLGGHRWFFLCPKCSRRVSKLFLPPKGGNTLEQKYLCKNCHGLKNQSAVMGQNRIYRQVTKPLKRLREIERKLENGYLGSERIKAYLDEYEAIEQAMKNTPEYRLYVFKRTRNLK